MIYEATVLSLHLSSFDRIQKLVLDQIILSINFFIGNYNTVLIIHCTRWHDHTKKLHWNTFGNEIIELIYCITTVFNKTKKIHYLLNLKQ